MAGQGANTHFRHPSIVAAAMSDPSGFCGGLETPVTLDEVQHVPELFPVIKSRYRRKRQPGRVFARGRRT